MKNRRKTALDVPALREQEAMWRGFMQAIKMQAKSSSRAEKQVSVDHAWQLCSLGRRYFRRRAWTRYAWRLDLDAPEQEQPQGSITATSSTEEIDAYCDGARTIMKFVFCESLYNTLANAHDEAYLAGQDHYEIMYQSFIEFLTYQMPALKITWLSAWSAEDAIASLSGFLVSLTTKNLSWTSESSLRSALARNYSNVHDGLLSEVVGEVAPVLLNQLREAEAGKTPNGLDLHTIKNAALANIRGQLQEPPIPQSERSLNRLIGNQETVSVEQQAIGSVRAQEMRRQAELLTAKAPGEWEVFRLMTERPDITESQMATELGVDIGTIKTRKTRLRAKLEKAGWAKKSERQAA